MHGARIDLDIDVDILDDPLKTGRIPFLHDLAYRTLSPFPHRCKKNIAVWIRQE